MSPNPTLSAFINDGEQFASLIDDIDQDQWDTPTPAPGWSVKDQVGHVAFVFDIAALACTDAHAFKRQMSDVAKVGFEAAVQSALTKYTAGSGEDTRERWRAKFSTVERAISQVDTATVPWLVKPLPPQVLTMAGMLEMFAHGQDIADALSRDIERTDTLAHLVHFVARTRDFGYESHGLTPPDHDFRFDVTLPSGRALSVGPPDAVDVVTGPAEHLCLLASRRRHVQDLDVSATGSQAQEWLHIAQAYRGSAGDGREPSPTTF